MDSRFRGNEVRGGSDVQNEFLRVYQNYTVISVIYIKGSCKYRDVFQEVTSGFLSNQGWAFSNCPANRNSKASFPKGPMNWTPKGSPSVVQ